MPLPATPLTIGRKLKSTRSNGDAKPENLKINSFSMRYGEGKVSVPSI
jgi:hypothetical protein